MNTNFSDERIAELREEFNAMHLPDDEFESYVEWVEEEEEKEAEAWRMSVLGELRYSSSEYDW